MPMYATPSELAGALQKDLDTYSATQAITRATERFADRADRRWDSTAGSFTTSATYSTSIEIPFRDVTSVTAVKVNGVLLPVDYTLRLGSVWRDAGFGNPSASPPDEVMFEFMYGEEPVPGAVWDAVLSLAASIYEHPDPGVVSESIDDYRVQYGGNTVELSGLDWREVADSYRGIAVA